MRIPRRASLVAVALVATALATPATAVPTCTFDPPTATISVTVGDGETAIIGRSGDAITLNATPCDAAATVSTTDAVDVAATGTPTEVGIDLAGGPFAPGLTAEADGGTSEIEFQVTLPSGSPIVRVTGGTGDDHVVVGSGGINLNATEAVADVDVTISGAPAIVVQGADGADVLSTVGGGPMGSPVSGVTLRGDAGDDLLLAGLGPNTLEGGDGTDTLDYAAVTQLGRADLGGGATLHVDGSVDTLATIENLTGSPGDDTIIGGTGDNALRGGAGNDVIEGGDGNDQLFGGDGVDTVQFRDASSGVAVDLRTGTATGAGNDVLAEFENVIGSDRGDTIFGDGGDNLLRGLYGADVLHGRSGNDVVRGGKGRDQLFGGRGDDLLQAGHNRDQLNGGQGNDVCRGAPGPDSFVFCENFPTRE